MSLFFVKIFCFLIHIFFAANIAMFLNNPQRKFFIFYTHFRLANASPTERSSFPVICCQVTIAHNTTSQSNHFSKIGKVP